MSKIIIEPKNNEESKSLEAYLKQQGILFKTEEEYQIEKQKQSMHLFAELISQAPKIDISGTQIDAIVEEVRAKRYKERY